MYSNKSYIHLKKESKILIKGKYDILFSDSYAKKKVPLKTCKFMSIYVSKHFSLHIEYIRKRSNDFFTAPFILFFNVISIYKN